MANYACHRHHLATLAADSPDKGACKISAPLVIKDIWRKDETRAKHARIMPNYSN